MVLSNHIFSLDKSGWLSTMAKWNVNSGKGLDNIYFIFLKCREKRSQEQKCWVILVPWCYAQCPRMDLVR